MLRDYYQKEYLAQVTLFISKNLPPEITGKNIESQLLEKDKEIQLLRRHDSYNADAIVTLSDQVRKLTEQMELLRK
jgi:hypothetical protein